MRKPVAVAAAAATLGPSGGRPCLRGDCRARTAISGRGAPPATALHQHLTSARLPVSHSLAGFGITDLADAQIAVASRAALPGLRRPSETLKKSTTQPER
jgi:hypothetical protein